MACIKKHIDAPLKVNGCVYYLLHWFAEHNKSMQLSNEEGVPRLLRWIINDVSNTIEKDLNDAMKKMQLGWVKDYTDEERLLLDEYRRQKQENSIDAMKEKLRISYMQRKELDEELPEVQERRERILNFIEEKRQKVNEVDLMNLTEREEIRIETEEEEEIEEEEVEEDGKEKKEDEDIEEEEDDKDDDDNEGSKDNDDKEGSKGGDMHDDKDDDDDERGGKGGDMHDDHNDKEGSKGGDDEHGTESEKNEVPSETPEKRSTPLSKTNEEKDGKDGTRQGVESGYAKKPSTSLPEKSDAYQEDQDATYTSEIDEDTIIACEAISQLDPKDMLPVEEDVLLLTKGEDQQNDPYASIEDLLDNLSESFS
ncbi:proline-, glutamic acid- and leucine-rich protein 1-like [Papaver somniferum]|uniref:proline-, glutamic acid- and leucine-rich protein 1-like n=1 Tax=Papaver somniferum TaxID=3469 RepID=UPI000E6F8AAE|nr:proline-, glutamic acid- and leucine-rich protein 1-like [Papaver somniferum]